MRDETKPHRNKGLAAEQEPLLQEGAKKGFIMKNQFAVSFAENTIVATKTTLKKASVPNSPEYKALMKLMKQNPMFTVSEKVIKTSTGKTTYKGLNTAFIQQYISIQKNSAKLTKQYEKAAEMGKFPLVRRWFLNTFENFNMESAKKELTEAAVAKVISISAEQQNKIVDMPRASGLD